ncbi:MAG: radical SAM protein [Patescibacteria group bacterium]
MKILFINPPTENMLTTNIPEVIEEGKGAIPPLGIMYIASYLKKYTDHKIQILDLQLEEKNKKEIQEYLLQEKPDVVGLTAITFLMIDTIKLINLISKILPDTKIVLGGPHVNIYPNETIDIPGIDFLVLGEGEIPCLDLINNIEDKEKLKTIKGLVFKHDGQIVNTGNRELLEDLDQLPHPVRELTNYKKYYSTLSYKNPTTSMFTSRGCPYKCIFCDRPHLGKNFRARSAQNIVDEMEEIKELGIHEIFIYDDTFTINRERVVEVCNEILKRNLKINWDIRARVNTIDEELLILMKKAGCVRIHYGVESGVNEILKNLRKGITVDMVKKAFLATKKARIETAAYFMIGCPGEKLKDINQSIKLAKDLKPDYVHFSVLTPFPATEIYLVGLKNGLIKEDVWQKFAKHPTKDFVPPLWKENFNRVELIYHLKRAYKIFYLRPSYIFNRIFKLRSFTEFLNKAKVGLKMLRI